MSLSAQLDFKVTITNATNNVKKLNKQLSEFLKLLKANNRELRKNQKQAQDTFKKIKTSVNQGTGAINKQTESIKRNTAQMLKQRQAARGMGNLGGGARGAAIVGTQQIEAVGRGVAQKIKSMKMATTVLKSLKTATLAYLGTLGVQKLLAFAEAAQATGNRLRVARRPGENIAKSFDRISKIALRTRQPLVELATMYSRITLATKRMNVTQEQAFKITENFGKLLTIQGTSAHEARSALTQFTQALQSGKLAGDEFRSISENLPPILEHLAEATGRPRDQLKAMAEQGKLDTALLLKAMLAATDQINEDFKKTQVTVAQAGNVINTTITIMVKKFMDSKNGGRVLMSVFNGIVSVLKVLGAVLTVIFRTISGLIDIFEALTKGINKASKALGGIISSGFGLGKLFSGGDLSAEELDKRTEALKRFGVEKGKVDKDTFGALGGASPQEQARMSEEEKTGENITTETLPVIKRNMDDLIQTFQEFEMAFKDLIFNTITKQFAGGVGNAFADMVVAGKSFNESMKALFKDMAKQVIAQITKMIVQMMIMKGLMMMLGLGGTGTNTTGSGGNAASADSILKGFMGPSGTFKPKNIMKGFGFAEGGRVTGGGPYVVGEEGPELFQPSSAGNITPNDEMEGAMGGGVVIQNLSIMPNSSIDQALMDKPASYWLEMVQEKILPSLNTLGQGGETTTMEFRGVR